MSASRAPSVSSPVVSFPGSDMSRCILGMFMMMAVHRTVVAVPIKIAYIDYLVKVIKKM